MKRARKNPVKTDIVTGPAHWASFFVNDDASGLTTAEAKAARQWLDENAPGGVMSVVEDSERFTNRYRLYGGDAGAGTVIDYIVDVTPRRARRNPGGRKMPRSSRNGARGNPRRRSSFQIGTISSGTLRTEDMIDAALDAIGILVDSEYATDDDKARWRAEVDKLPDEDSEDYDEEASGLLDEMEQFISERTPDYVYYGGHGGDPADVGFWISWESVEEARRDGELPDYDDLPKGYSGLAIDVNDHGNATLYVVRKGGKAEEVWSVV